MTQLPLPLGTSAEAREAEFLVTESNAAAAERLERHAEWPVRAALLVGPPQSGKSLLARIFASRTGASVVDDAETAEEAALFHLWNAAQASGRLLLIVAKAPPPEWPVALPDLHSRLMASPLLRIGPPDDALMRLLLSRRLDERALTCAPEMIDWLVRRIERSHAALFAATDILHAEAERRGNRRLSVASARTTLEAAGLLHNAEAKSESP